jgi:hypothetical protein
MTARLRHPVRNGSRDGSAPGSGGQEEGPLPTLGGSRCSVCSDPLPSARARFCSAACRQRAFRLRHTDRSVPHQDRLRETLRRQRTLVAHTVYACPNCDERFVARRRCPDCNLFNRALGLGGQCPECEMPILLADLLGQEVLL